MSPSFAAAVARSASPVASPAARWNASRASSFLPSWCSTHPRPSCTTADFAASGHISIASRKTASASFHLLAESSASARARNASFAPSASGASRTMSRMSFVPSAAVAASATRTRPRRSPTSRRSFAERISA